MKTLVETVCVKRWQVLLLLAMSGYALGNILSTTMAAVGS